MKAMNHFVVELDKPFHDTLTTKGGMHIHIDPKWNEFEHRVMEGPVTALPAKHDTEVSIGDTLYFHHRVVLQDGQRLGAGENDYLVLYDPNICVSNQSIAYKDKDTEEVHTLGDWCLLSPIDQEDDVSSEIIEIIRIKKSPPKTAKLWRGNQITKDLGLKEGDVVAFKTNMDYSVKIDGEEKFRIDPEDLLYVCNS